MSYFPRVLKLKEGLEIETLRVEAMLSSDWNDNKVG